MDVLGVKPAKAANGEKGRVAGMDVLGVKPAKAANGEKGRVAGGCAAKSPSPSSPSNP